MEARNFDIGIAQLALNQIPQAFFDLGVDARTVEKEGADNKGPLVLWPAFPWQASTRRGFLKPPSRSSQAANSDGVSGGRVRFNGALKADRARSICGADGLLAEHD